MDILKINKSIFTGYIENNHPNFLLIPFRKSDIFSNRQISKNAPRNLVRLLENRFPNKYITITTSARMALKLALDSISIQEKTKFSNVYIQTTSNNRYISSCVTDIISNNLKWTRERKFSKEITLFNHEFGYPDNRLLTEELDFKTCIEDCAFSFDSKFKDGTRVGSRASHSIFSFSKFFPIQFGGCLISDTPIENEENEELIRYVEQVVGYYFEQIPSWSTMRLELFEYYSTVFSSFGCTPVFTGSENEIPGVFLFNLPHNVDSVKLKEFYWKRGVQCSVFYGRQSFYLPLNQFITKDQIEYFACIFNEFLALQNE